MQDKFLKEDLVIVILATNLRISIFLFSFFDVLTILIYFISERLASMGRSPIMDHNFGSATDNRHHHATSSTSRSSSSSSMEELPLTTETDRNLNLISSSSSTYDQIKFDNYNNRRLCVPFKIEFCKQLPYNFTSFPNALGHQGPEEAKWDIEKLR